jgi:hypothetical protein
MMISTGDRPRPPRLGGGQQELDERPLLLFDERRACCRLGRRQRPQLLGLVDHQRQPDVVLLVAQHVGGEQQRAIALGELAAQRQRVAQVAAVQLRQRRRQHVQRPVARLEDGIAPALLPGSAPPLSSGISPARTTLLLPLPDAPSTARNVVRSTRETSSATSASRPKNRSASRSWKVRRPRYGGRSSRGPDRRRSSASSVCASSLSACSFSTTR